MEAGTRRNSNECCIDYKQQQGPASDVEKGSGSSARSPGSQSRSSGNIPMTRLHQNSIDFLSITRFGLQCESASSGDTFLSSRGRHTDPYDMSDDIMSDSDSSTAADCESPRSTRYGATFTQVDQDQLQQHSPQANSVSATTNELDLLRECIATSDLARADRQKALASLNKLQQYALRKPVQSLRDKAAFTGCGRACEVKLRSLEDRLDSLNAYVQLEAKSRASMSALYDYEFMRVGHDMLVTKNNADALRVQMQEMAGYSDEDHASAVEADTFTMHAVADMVVEEKIGKLQATIDEEQKRRAALTVLVEGLPSNIASTLEKSNTSVANVQTLFRVDLDCVRDALEVNKEEMGQRTSDIASEVCELRKAWNRTNTHLIDLQEEVDCVHPHVGGFLQTSSDAATEDLKSSSGSLEKLSLRSVEDRLEQLRRTTIGFDSDLDRANYRISQLEADVRKAFDDRDTADLELQLGDLNAKHDALAAKVDYDSTKIHFLGCVSSVAFDLEVLHINARIAELEKSSGSNVNDDTLAACKEQLDDLRLKHFALARTCARDWRKQDAEMKRLRCEVEALPGRAALGDVDLGDLYNRLDMAADFDMGVLDRMDNIEMQLGLPVGGSVSGGPLRQNRYADLDDEYAPL
ncbi:hypothetical protein LTR17_014898 [Elasticomyces elasticus]|nr:hypothetical protein LTR17_014898 [Elasticomyces elasticus]